MTEWRFGETADDGEQWLARPDLMYAYVEYRKSGSQWRRLMVATKGWLLQHLSEVQASVDQPKWVMIPTMLIVPDEKGDALRRAVETVIQQGGFDSYSTPV